MWDFPLFPERASTLAGRVDALYAFLVWVAVAFSVLIFSLLIAFAVKYRRRTGPVPHEPAGPHATGDVRLELLWIAVPLALTIVMFAWGSTLYLEAARAPEDADDVYVVAKQWMWKLPHGSGAREINELHVPLGRPVKLTLTSEDVIHSFYVPAFRIKMDAVPGRYTS